MIRGEKTFLMKEPLILSYSEKKTKKAFKPKLSK